MVDYKNLNGLKLEEVHEAFQVVNKRTWVELQMLNSFSKINSISFLQSL